MAQVSRRILNKELEKRIFELFIKTIVDLKNPEEVEIFVKDLLSPTEKIMLAKRLAIAILLSKNYTYDDIDQTLKVSSPTIMNVSYFLKNGEGYQKVINKILNSQRKEELMDRIEEIFLRLSPPKAYQSIAYERKRKLGRELFKRKIKRATL